MKTPAEVAETLIDLDSCPWIGGVPDIRARALRLYLHWWAISLVRLGERRGPRRNQ